MSDGAAYFKVGGRAPAGAQRTDDTHFIITRDVEYTYVDIDEGVTVDGQGYEFRYNAIENQGILVNVVHPVDMVDQLNLATDEETAAEATARAAADTAEATTRAAGDTSEASTRATADTTESTARSAADTSEASTRGAADAAEVTARAAADTAEATARVASDAAEAATRAAANLTRQKQERARVLGSRLIFSGHSIAASGGASQPDRGWGNILAGMLRAQDWSIARGGAVLTWGENQTDRWVYSPYPVAGITGDGGWATFLQEILVTPRGVKWQGVWASGTTYKTGEGVYTTGPLRFWRASQGGSNHAPASSPTYWTEITDYASAGAGSYTPMPGVHVMCFGINDLGWGKELTPFLQALRVIIARAIAGRVFEDNSGMWTYTSFGGSSPLAQINSGDSVRNLISAGIGGTAVCQVPSDWPGGKARIGIMQNPVQNYSTGKLMITLDGVDVREIDCTILRQSSVTNTKSIEWIETVDVSAGAHTVGLRITQAFPAGAATYLDYLSLDAAKAPPVVFVGLHKPPTYAAYTNPLPTDADVDTWNAAIAAMLVAEFPSVKFVEPTSISGSNRAGLYRADQLHPNDRGHALLAAEVYGAILDMDIDDELLALSTVENRAGNTFFARYGNAGANQSHANDNTWRTVAMNAKNIEGYVAAQPNDLIRIDVTALWDASGTGYGYCDVAVIGSDGAKIGYVSATGTLATQLTNGISGAIADATHYRPLLPTTQYYMVRDSDIVDGIVTFQVIAKVTGGSGARLITGGAASSLDVFLENLGPMDGLRPAYAL